MLRIPVTFVLAASTLGGSYAASCNDVDKLTASDGATSDEFGWAVSVFGNQALVGARFHDEAGNQAGAAYLFDVQTGDLIQKFTAGGTTPGYYFGWSVALGPEHIVVGAIGSPGGGASSGEVHVFDSDGTLLHVLQPADLSFSAAFGTSLALAGDRVVVGAPGGGAGSSADGAAYVFDLTTGAQITKLVASDGVVGDRLGFSVGIVGDRVLLGAPGHTLQLNDEGAAYVFDLVTGAELFKLTASDGLPADGFGGSVDFDGDLAVIGASGCDDLGQQSGAAYVFSVSTGNELAKLLPQDGSGLDFFGQTVAIQGDRIAVAAPEEDGFGLGQDIGAVYLFDAADFGERAKLIPAGISTLNLLGTSLDIQGDFVIAGARLDDEIAVNAGAAYVFSADSELQAASFCGGISCPCGNDSNIGGCRNSTGNGGQLIAAGTGSLACDDAVVTARRIPMGAFGLMFMGGANQSPNPLGDGLLCLSGGLYRFPVQTTGTGGRIVKGPGLAAEACSTFGAAGCITAGSTWMFQAWVRDAAGPCGNGSNTTNAVALTFTP